MTQPTTLSTNVLHGIADVLREGRLDASQTLGCLATAVIVEVDGGTWEYPLIGGIDVVDRVDAAHMASSGVDAHVVLPDTMNHLAAPELQVRWTGTDDMLRSSTVDIARAVFTRDDLLR